MSRPSRCAIVPSPLSSRVRSGRGQAMRMPSGSAQQSCSTSLAVTDALPDEATPAKGARAAGVMSRAVAGYADRSQLDRTGRRPSPCWFEGAGRRSATKARHCPSEYPCDASCHLSPLPPPARSALLLMMKGVLAAGGGHARRVPHPKSKAHLLRTPPFSPRVCSSTAVEQSMTHTRAQGSPKAWPKA